MQSYRLPDGTVVPSVEQYANSWDALCLAFEIAIPDIKVVSFDPSIEFKYQNATYTLPPDIVSKIISLYYLASREEEALKDERTKLWKEVSFGC